MPDTGRFLLLLAAVAALGTALPDAAPVQPLLKASGTSVDTDLAGSIVLLDRASSTLSLLDRHGTVRARIGAPGWSNDHFDAPAGLWARNGLDIFVADYGNHRIQRFDRGLAYVGSFSTREGEPASARFGYPLDVALSRLGDLFLLDGENNRVVKVNGFTTVERTFGGFDAGAGRLLEPRRLEVGPDDRVYVLDRDRVVVFDAFGNYLHALVWAGEGGPRALHADDRGLVAAGDSTLQWYSPDDRPGSAADLRTAVRAGGAVLDLAARGDSLCLLLERGILFLPDPRPR
jgi:hypothetical protein